MQDATEDPGGDLRAVEGTEAEVAVETDRPLTKGVLVLGDDNQIALEGSGTTLTRARADPEGWHVSRGRDRERRGGPAERRLLSSRRARTSRPR